jgi:peroxiredoxin Q/BCP
VLREDFGRREICFKCFRAPARSSCSGSAVSSLLRFTTTVRLLYQSPLACSNPPTEETSMPIEEGKVAPAFTLKDAAGKNISLKDLRGKHVIVYFYPKDDTPGCTKEACGFRDLWKDIRKHGAVVLGVSPDDEPSHKAFSTKYKLPFTLLSDPDRKVMSKYDAFGEKMMYGKKTIGVIRSTVWIGPDGKVRKHWKRVPKAADHPRRVLEELQAGDK